MYVCEGGGGGGGRVRHGEREREREREREKGAGGGGGGQSGESRGERTGRRSPIVKREGLNLHNSCMASWREERASNVVQCLHSRR